MTEIYHVQRKADDLRLGNMFVDWAVMPRGPYPKPRRIINLKEHKGNIRVYLDDMSTYVLRPEHIVIVQEIA
jgi:hypothetical protein